MIPGIIAGFVAGFLIVWVIMKGHSHKIKADYEERINLLKNNITSFRYQQQEADANHTRFDLEIRKHRDLRQDTGRTGQASVKGDEKTNRL